MSLAYTLNLGLRPSLPSRTILRAVRSPLQSRSIHTTNPFHRRVADTHVIVRSARPSAGRGGQATRTTLYAIGLGTAFIGLSSRAPAQCQSVTARSPAGSGTGGLGEAQPPQSVLSLYELGFGTVAGICSGVFLKKGLRAIAFLLGGAFILLQYLSSKSYVSVDWARLSKAYDGTFGTRTASGGSRAPTVQGAWNRLVDFITANFQQRASFLAGFVLGIRLG